MRTSYLEPSEVTISTRRCGKAGVAQTSNNVACISGFVDSVYQISSRWAGAFREQRFYRRNAKGDCSDLKGFGKLQVVGNAKSDVTRVLFLKTSKPPRAVKLTGSSGPQLHLGLTSLLLISNFPGVAGQSNATAQPTFLNATAEQLLGDHWEICVVLGNYWEILIFGLLIVGMILQGIQCWTHSPKFASDTPRWVWLLEFTGAAIHLLQRAADLFEMNCSNSTLEFVTLLVITVSCAVLSSCIVWKRCAYEDSQPCRSSSRTCSSDDFQLFLTGIFMPKAAYFLEGKMRSKCSDDMYKRLKHGLQLLEYVQLFLDLAFLIVTACFMKSREAPSVPSLVEALGLSNDAASLVAEILKSKLLAYFSWRCVLDLYGYVRPTIRACFNPPDERNHESNNQRSVVVMVTGI